MPRSQLNKLARVVTQILEKSPEAKLKVRGADGSYISLDNREIGEAMQASRGPATIFDELAFHEAYQYLDNAKARFAENSPAGYSDCKANCRSALISVLKTLTGEENVGKAAKELGARKILGKREQEFVERFDGLLVSMHGVLSKKGPHPPMTREEGDAKFALDVTVSVIRYVTTALVDKEASHDRKTG